MKIYFAVSDVMLDKQGLSEKLKDKPFHWSLSHGQGKYGESFLASYLAKSAGDIVNAMEEFKINKPYTVCCAKVAESDLLEGLRASMVGDVMWEVHVIIDETTRIA